MALKIEEKYDGIRFDVRVVPRAARSMIAGEHAESLKIRIAAPPVDGAANEEIVAFIAKAFGVAKNTVTIEKGLTSRNKKIRIKELKREEFLACLNRILNA